MLIDLYLSVGFVATVCLHRCEQCSPVEPLRNVLEAAEKNLTSGRIVLNMDRPSPAVSKVPMPPCQGKSNLATMYRIPAGETAMFNCTVPKCANRESCPEVDGIMWGHRNYSISRVLSQYYSSPFIYNVSKNATFSHFFIHNVTADAAGPVHCVWTDELDKSCIMGFYDLRPLLTAEDIFVTTAQTVSRPAGKTVTMRCDLKAPLKGELPLEQRYMWWYEGQAIMAPSEHPMAGLVRPAFPVDFVHGGSYISATLTDPPKSRSGRYQCWVRPFEKLDEWFVQDISLYLT